VLCSFARGGHAQLHGACPTRVKKECGTCNFQSKSLYGQQHSHTLALDAMLAAAGPVVKSAHAPSGDGSSLLLLLLESKLLLLSPFLPEVKGT